MVITLLTQIDSFRYFAYSSGGVWIQIIAIFIVFATLIILFCWNEMAKRVPYNYILLTLFTMCESYFLAVLCAEINDNSAVLTVAFLTAGMVSALTLYAYKSDYDPSWGTGLLVVISAAMVLMLPCLFFSATWEVSSYFFTFCYLVMYGIYLFHDV
mmetsp:Transcript_29291/g.26772  ORF Transcript_29291/g.26772 Transcript_29291/m.26772 type:complete len:156 (-) Transcript_29291:209-676(-)